MGLLLLIFMLILFSLSIPIAFGLGLTTLLALWMIEAPLLIVPQRIIFGIDSFPLLAVPFFLLAGSLMNTGGITQRIFRFANCLIGHITGGLGHVNVLASMIFAGMSGSALADAAGLGTIEIKAMLEEGYDVEFSAGITAASATIGPIIPPSIPMVIYGVMAEVSIGRLFIGGFIPGVLMGLSLMVLVYLISRERNYPRHKQAVLKEIFHSFKEAFLPLLTPIIILGGILGGIFTPTEAAAVATAYAFILGVFVYRETKLVDLPRIFLEVAVTTAALMFIIGIASLTAWIIAREQLALFVAKWVLSITSNPKIVLLFLNIIMLILGCFMEAGAIIIMLVPLIYHLIISAGIDTVHFGVVMVLNLMIGLLTPPVGMCLYAVSDVAKISVERVIRGTLPFIVPLIVVLFLITYIPSLVLFLPNLIFGTR